jgi:hypothetical protein
LGSETRAKCYVPKREEVLYEIEKLLNKGKYWILTKFIIIAENVDVKNLDLG